MITRRLTCLWLLVGTMAVLVTGCAAVKPYEREFLADRIMDIQEDARLEKLDQKWLEAREGSTGGAIGAGGGCACN